MAGGEAGVQPHGEAPKRTVGSGVAVPCYGAIDEQAIREHLAADRFFWLDLTAPGEEEVGKLRELFGFHPLALEDAEHFGQRPKLDHYGDYVFLVFYGAREQAADAGETLREVQMFISGKVVTPQRDLFARSIDQLADLPGLELDERDYFRDVYDHLIRISDRCNEDRG